MKSTTVVALMGPAGSGKSTAAKHLVERYGARAYSFAQPLKEMARALWGFTDAQLYGTQAEKEAIDPRWNMSPRVALQKLGTDACRRHLGDDIWTRACLERIVRERPQLAVIEDLRFENEAKAVLALQYRSDIPITGIVVKLECPDRQSSTDEVHASEREWRTALYTTCLSVTRAEGVTVLQQRLDEHLGALGVRP